MQKFETNISFSVILFSGSQPSRSWLGGRCRLFPSSPPASFLLFSFLFFIFSSLFCRILEAGLVAVEGGLQRRAMVWQEIVGSVRRWLVGAASSCLDLAFYFLIWPPPALLLCAPADFTPRVMPFSLSLKLAHRGPTFLKAFFSFASSPIGIELLRSSMQFLKSLYRIKK